MEESTFGRGVELPLYTCHKQVRASKIMHIVYEHPFGGAAKLIVELPTMATPPHVQPRIVIDVAESYVAKHEPAIGGYYVRYEDGYESFSPAAAFEAGYTLLDNCVPGT